jgi:predicted DNA-binding protein (UPF0251 family)
MPRPRIRRRIRVMPEVTYFKPAGVPMADLGEVILSVDEYEAVRLVDFKGVGQDKAGKKMKISQPTLSRLLKSARKKLSNAIINGKAIRIQGGSYQMVQPRGRGMGRGRGFGAGAGMGRMGGAAMGPGGVCRCPKCGHQEAQVRGQPCMNKKCPKCGTLMIRGE